MLQELSIQNLAIIDQLTVDFSNGMTVLTGETGAGKSIIIDAVGLLAGNRGSQSYIRTGENKLILQGLFVFPKNNITYHLLDQLGIDHDDGNVILQREIYRNGRNICRVNGMLVNTNTLKKIGVTMIEIDGQNEHQELMKPENHIKLLDEFAHQKIDHVLKQYRTCYHEYHHLKAIIDDKIKNQKQWSQQIDMLTFQVNDIKNADLKDGEEEELVNERKRLQNHQKINDALTKSYGYINGDETVSPLDMVGQSMNAMQQIEELDPSFRKISESLRNSYYALQDVSNSISNQLELQDSSEGRLDQIEERLNTIYNLKHKYGDSIKQILNYYQKIKNELDQMQSSDNNETKLNDQFDQIKGKLKSLAHKLSHLRHQAADRLESSVHKQLSDLYMGKTVFEVRFHSLPIGEYTSNGNEKIEFYIQTNPGESIKPLPKIASGGELSRIMLALKTVFSDLQGVTSIMFDEVDTGVSGRVAQAMANKISGIAKHTQVLCITHLPQVAAMSDHHYFISKKVIHGRTKTNLEKLSNRKRVDELARMLAGTTITKLTLEHANELLRLANKAKKDE
ncbi:DNA repair protein RecN [Philodulcilactobacillus myokoensis]|uniref:DNA repair protein RecN n=1 Tax=Philodulcilactobacillus myokoensis TaxID=2929573 RepID=A0A9W6ESI2_9LACO|nr:DNA repair protein RecN [Philodulcilactobacillus myokoensis]GLB46805.1 DNA repair protein RecN [Philodulcilactobacillus myokoensis]